MERAAIAIGGEKNGIKNGINHQDWLQDIVTDFRHYTVSNFESIPQVASLPDDLKFAIKVVAQVLPFKVNQYVIDELIDWSNVPDDPMFQLTFPQPGMLEPEQFNRVADLLKKGDREQLKRVVNGFDTP